VIKKKSIKVGLKGQAAVLEGELAKEVKVDDSTWTLGASLSLLLLCSPVPTGGRA
jgi:hypothetical protein